MKKLFRTALFTSILVLLTFAMTQMVSATSAFDELTVNSTTEFIDSDNPQHSADIGICYAENYGTGYAYIGDYVVFRGVDFGSKAPDMFWVKWGRWFAGADTVLKVYVDGKSDTGKLICTISLGQTTGDTWEYQSWFGAPCENVTGVHDVFVEFVNDAGTFSAIKFSSYPSAFDNQNVTGATELIDCLDPQHPAGIAIGYADAYGTTFGFTGDYVVFRNLDFGSTGSDKVKLSWAMWNAVDTTTTGIKVYIDGNADTGTLVSEFNAPYTGGDDKIMAQEILANCIIPAGKHDVYVLYVNGGGSVSGITFIAAPEPESEPENPKTGNGLALPVALCAVAVPALVICIKKKAVRT